MTPEPEEAFLRKQIAALRRLAAAINRQIDHLETRVSDIRRAEDVRRGGCDICHWTEGHDPRCALAGKADQ